MFKMFFGLVIIIPAVFGLFLLLAPASNLATLAQRGLLGLRMPPENSVLFKILIAFYRFIGLLVLGFSGFAVFILITQSR